MPTRKQLKGAYSEMEAMAMYQEVKRTGDFASFCQRFMGDEDYQVARNALWALTKASDEEIKTIQPLMNDLIDLATTTDNSSVRRLALHNVERLQMNEEDLTTEFLDFCLEHMVSIEEYPGIQTLCMKLAFKMCRFYHELMDEFLRTVEGMEIAYYKPAVKSLRERILSGKYK